VPFILAHLARAAAAIFALLAADIRRRFFPATSGVVVSPKMDASRVSSCSICSLIAIASRSCAALRLLRGVINALVVRHSPDRVNERDCDPSPQRLGLKRPHSFLKTNQPLTNYSFITHLLALSLALIHCGQLAGCRPKQAVWLCYAHAIYPVAQTDHQTFQDQDWCQEIDTLLILILAS